MKRIFSKFWLPGLIALVVVAAVLAATLSSGTNDKSGQLQIMAGENFWGSLVSQLGGSKVQVTSIVSDPAADPHEYTSSSANARSFATADYVVLNGAGYDSWGDKLLSANPNASRQVLKISDLLGKKEGDNPHFWYNPGYVNQVIAKMESDLIALQPSNRAYFEQQYAQLKQSLSGYQSKIAAIKSRHAGNQVAATEDIFVYLADAAGLNLSTPASFMEAVAEGTDPPVSSVVEFQNQLNSGQVKVLVYNQQTSTPLTESMKKLAQDRGIPIVGITETLQPPNASFQTWMDGEVQNLENALNTGSATQ
ncbi:MAG: periplasmic solute binding protein [Candidatus Saccharibacteria bacterium]|nr:periplasmic solute binding protein [Candidatus Saccharibacteria bacterium]